MNTDKDDKVTGPGDPKTSFSALCERRYSRREFVRTGVALGVATSLAGCAESAAPKRGSDEAAPSSPASALEGSFNFEEIEHGFGENLVIAAEHHSEVLLRWGDPVLESAPEFDVNAQSVESQLGQFGVNNDYIGYLEIPTEDGQQARALLCVNHEYPSVGLMFPNLPESASVKLSAEQVFISQAAVGASIVEIAMREGQWQFVKSSKYNRRISAYDSLIHISGPAAGHERLKTKADPEGVNVIGTFNNCAGGMTPWGTYLTCEENFNYHFSGSLEADHPEVSNHNRYNLPLDLFQWGSHDPRFNIDVEPREPNRFGWVVEIDPLNPQSIPKKRSALGRFKHEGAESVIAKDGRLVVYMGDDQRFEYLYKFVSRDVVNLEDREANSDLLDHGTLYVARFAEEGGLQWLPLDMSNKLLSDAFASQAEIVIEARRAADLLDATPMDRPEDVVPKAGSGKVYVMLSNNKLRTEVNGPNPRSANLFGQIVEIHEADDDFSANNAKWDILVQCGDPTQPAHQANWNANTSKNGWFASPDNATIDPQGRLWVSSDQGPKAVLSGTSDGLWALETEGSLRGTGKMFCRVPNGAEMTGPVFSDDGNSLFLAVQHPGAQVTPGGARFDTATTLWPDFKPGMPPRSSIVVVRRITGGAVG